MTFCRDLNSSIVDVVEAPGLNIFCEVSGDRELFFGFGMRIFSIFLVCLMMIPPLPLSCVMSVPLNVI